MPFIVSSVAVLVPGEETVKVLVSELVSFRVVPLVRLVVVEVLGSGSA